MATARQVKAGAAYVEVLLDKSPFLRGIRSLERDFLAVGKVITGLGLGLISYSGSLLAPFQLATNEFVETASRLEDLSIQTGVASSSLAKMSYVAQQTGSDLETIKKAIVGQGKLFLQLQQGSKGAAEIFDALGISANQFARLSQEDRFALLIERISQIRDTGVRAAVAMKVFGRAGFQMGELIRGGATGLQALLKEAKDLGVVITDEDISRGDELGDTFLKVRTAAEGLRNVVGASLVGLFTELAQKTADYIGVVANYINRNRELVVISAKVAAVVGVVGAAITVLGGSLIATGLVLHSIGTTFQAVMGIGTALSAILTFLISPFGILTTLVVAGAVAFFRYTDAGSQMVSFLVNNFGKLLDFSQKVFKGIAKAIGAGDVKLAAEILWSTIELAWLNGKHAVFSETQDMRIRINEKFLDMMYGAHIGIIKGWEFITKTFRDYSRLVIDEFAVIANAAQRDFFEPVSKDLAKFFLWATTPLGDVAALAQGEQSIEDTFNDKAREREQQFLDGILAREQRSNQVAAERARALGEEITRLKAEAALAKEILTETDNARLAELQNSIKAKSDELQGLLEQSDKIEFGALDGFDGKLKDIAVSGIFDGLGENLKSVLDNAVQEVKTVVSFSSTEAGRTSGFLAGQKKNPNETLERLTSQQNNMLREQLAVFKNLEVAE